MIPEYPPRSPSLLWSGPRLRYSSEPRSGPSTNGTQSSDRTLGQQVEVEQQGGFRLGALGRELLEKEVVLEHLTRRIEVLLPLHPRARIDPGSIEGGRVIMREEIVRLNLPELSIDLPNLNRGKHPRARNLRAARRDRGPDRQPIARRGARLVLSQQILDGVPVAVYVAVDLGRRHPLWKGRGIRDQAGGLVRRQLDQATDRWHLECIPEQGIGL